MRLLCIYVPEKTYFALEWRVLFYYFFTRNQRQQIISQNDNYAKYPKIEVNWDFLGVIIRKNFE